MTVPALDLPADPLPPVVPGVRRLAVLRANGVGDYVVAGNGTAKQALDGLATDWKATFEEEGKY